MTPVYPKRNWTAAEDQQLIDGHAARLSITAITASMDRTFQAVVIRASKLGLRFRDSENRRAVVLAAVARRDPVRFREAMLANAARKRAARAEAARLASLPAFERLMEDVAAGRVRVTERFIPTRPDPAVTLGGVATYG